MSCIKYIFLVCTFSSIWFCSLKPEQKINEFLKIWMYFWIITDSRYYPWSWAKNREKYSYHHHWFSSNKPTSQFSCIWQHTIAIFPSLHVANQWGKLVVIFYLHMNKYTPCVHLSMYMCVWVCVRACGCWRTPWCWSQVLSTFSLETVSLTALPTTHWTDWLASKPQGPTCLHFQGLGLYI